MLTCFHTHADMDGDGRLTRQDFDALAERFAKIQRHGQYEEDVVRRWRHYLSGWFDTLLKDIERPQQAYITFADWLHFCRRVAKLSDSYAELPDFVKQHANLHFIQIDGSQTTKKDGLVDINDWRAHWQQQSAMSRQKTSDEDACTSFAHMLNVRV